MTNQQGSKAVTLSAKSKVQNHSLIHSISSTYKVVYFYLLGLWKMCQGIEAFSLLTAQSLVNGLQTKKSVLIVKAENYYSQRTHTTQSENTELLQQRHQVSGGGNKRKRLP